MSASKLPDLFSPLLGASLAGFKYYSENNEEILKALGLAVVGGALGWLGKVMMKSLFMYIKGKIQGNDKERKEKA